LFFNFVLEFAIRKVQGNQVGPKINERHHLLLYADDVNLLGDNINTIKNTETLTDPIKGVGLQVNRVNYVYVTSVTRMKAKS
jgi:hypothetical protein